MPQTALITGATQGIGKELSLLCAEHGYNLVLVARNTHELQSQADGYTSDYGVMVVPIAMDLSQPDSAEKLVKKLTDHKLTIDFLINNAGFGTSGLFHTIDARKEEREITLNILTLTQLTRLLLPHMLKQKQGTILNVASTAAFLPGPLMSVYYATKAYVLSFSNALREELRGTGVSVSILCPGATRTGFADAADATKRMLFRGKLLKASDVAQAGFEGAILGKRIIFADRKTALIPLIARFIPPSLLARMAKKANS